MKKLFQFSLLIFSLFHALAVHADTPSCHITNIEDSLVKGRAKQIQFPGGHKVIVVGYTHGDRENEMNLESLFTRAGSRLTNTEFLQKLNEIRDAVSKNGGIELTDGTKISSTLEDTENNSLYLEKLLFNSQDIRIIADECTKEICEESARNSHFLFHVISEHFKERNLPVAEHLDVVRSALSVAGPYLNIKNPTLMQSRVMTGFESKLKIREEAQIQEKCDQMRNRFLLLVGDEKSEFLDDMRDLRGDLNLLRLVDSQDINETRNYVLKTINEKSPKQFLQASLDFANACLDSQGASLNRDSHVATELSKLKESAILFIGQAHLNSITRMISAQCKELHAKQSGMAQPGPNKGITDK